MKGDAAVSHGLASSPPRGERGRAGSSTDPSVIELSTLRANCGHLLPLGRRCPEGADEGAFTTEMMMPSDRLLAELFLQSRDDAEALAQERIDGERAAEGGERLTGLAFLDVDEAEARERAEVAGLQR
jgi:hypothetical protein